MLHTTLSTKSRLLFLFVSFISFFAFTLAVLAQEDSGPPNEFVTGVAGNPDALLCSEYYSFGAIEVEATASPEFVGGGNEVLFSGTIKNNNPEPLVNGQLHLKVFRKTNENHDEVVRNGYPLVEFTTLIDNLMIPAGETMPFEAVWNVPRLADGGEYDARFYVTENNETNMLGVISTDYVFGNGTTFWVGGEEDNIFFDKGSITINDQPVDLSGPIQRFGENELITVRATITNPSDETAYAELWWWVSNWDELSTDKTKARDLQGIEIPPNSTKEVSHIIPSDAGPGIVVQGILNQYDSKSVLHVRMVRDGQDSRNIGFAGVSPVVTEAGKKSTAFLCVQDLGNASAGNLDVVVTATDGSGTELFSHTVSTVTDANPTLVEVPFELSQDASFFTLHTQLLKDGEVIDETNKTYDCGKLGDSICGAQKKSTQEQNMVFVIIVTLLALMVLTATLVYMRKSKESLQDMHYPEN